MVFKAALLRLSFALIEISSFVFPTSDNLCLHVPHPLLTPELVPENGVLNCMTSRDFWRKVAVANDMQCGCFKMTLTEDGKLLSHLEWPNTHHTFLM